MLARVFFSASARAFRPIRAHPRLVTRLRVQAEGPNGRARRELAWASSLDAPRAGGREGRRRPSRRASPRACGSARWSGRSRARARAQKQRAQRQAWTARRGRAGSSRPRLGRSGRPRSRAGGRPQPRGRSPWGTRASRHQPCNSGGARAPFKARLHGNLIFLCDEAGRELVTPAPAEPARLCKVFNRVARGSFLENLVGVARREHLPVASSARGEYARERFGFVEEPCR